MSSKVDSISVRSGEELNIAALENYLNAHLGSQSGQNSVEVWQFPGGHSNLTYQVRYGHAEFVLRRPPLGPVAPTAHDMPREYRLLSVVHPQFPLAPKPVLLCEDPDVIGVPFYLMERRRGLILRSALPEALAGNPNLRQALSEAVVDTLVTLHAVEIQESGIVKLGKPAGFVYRQVHGWASRWQRSKTGDLPAMDEVIKWLKDRIPPDNLTATIVHNDFKLDNVMIDENELSRIVAVLDWEMCTVGDPLIDMGLFLTYWTMKGTGANRSLNAITNGNGWLTREQILDRYEKATGRDLSRIVFYETFARFKVAVVIQQIYFRYVRGQTNDERFRHFDILVSQLTEEALGMAQRSQV